MDASILAAIRVLPRHRKAIEELVLRSESFRALCSDLAEAEAALRRWETSSDPQHVARRVEFRHLVDGLEAELRQAMQERRPHFED